MIRYGGDIAGAMQAGRWKSTTMVARYRAPTQQSCHQGPFGGRGPLPALLCWGDRKRVLIG